MKLPAALALVWFALVILILATRRRAEAEEPESLEEEAGRLLVAAAKARAARGGPADVHELRHLFAAITAGNSGPCEGGAACHLDAALMDRLQLANWPEREPMFV